MLNYLIHFLAAVARRSHANKMTAANLSIVWAPTLFRASEAELTYSGMDSLQALEVANKMKALNQQGQVPRALRESTVCGEPLRRHGGRHERRDSEADGSTHSSRCSEPEFPPPLPPRVS